MGMATKRAAIISGIAAALLVLVTASPAGAWGGPNTFAGGDCGKYSIASNSAGNAGANTTLSFGATGVKVGFRGGGHSWIAPVSGSGTAISYISQATVNTYGIGGATHQCHTPSGPTETT